MKKKSSITIRLDSDLKHEAEKALREQGISLSRAVTILIERFVSQKKFPLPLSLPNEETREAMSDIANRRNVEIFESTDVLFSDLES